MSGTRTKDGPDGLQRRIRFLAVSGLFDYGLQIVLPVVLVRYLDTAEFGSYRLIWLIASTVLAFAPFFVPQSLFTFLPGVTPAKRAIVLGNSFTFLVASGVVCAILVSPLNPWLPSALGSLEPLTPLAQVFLGLWIVASMLDVLPTADGRAGVQAVITVLLAIARTVLLGAAAYATGAIAPVVWAMAFVAILKVAILVIYALRTTGRHTLDAGELRSLLRFCAPFAAANALFILRGQADQWIVVGMLSTEQFVLISIAAVVVQLSNLVRQPINNSLLPRVSECLAGGDRAGAEVAMSRGYLLAALLLPPLLGTVFVSADELIELVYTSKYRDAGLLVRVYLVGQAATVFASGHLLSVLRKGRASAAISAGGLVLSIVLGVIGVSVFGLVGAAIGSTVTLFVGEIAAFWIVVRTMEVPVKSLLPVRTVGLALAAVGVALVAGEASSVMLPAAASIAIAIGWKTSVYAAAWLMMISLFGLRRQFAEAIGG